VLARAVRRRGFGGEKRKPRMCVQGKERRNPSLPGTKANWFSGAAFFEAGRQNAAPPLSVKSSRSPSSDRTSWDLVCINHSVQEPGGDPAAPLPILGSHQGVRRSQSRSASVLGRIAGRVARSAKQGKPAARRFFEMQTGPPPARAEGAPSNLLFTDRTGRTDVDQGAEEIRTSSVAPATWGTWWPARPLSRQAYSPCWLTSRPVSSCSSATRSGMIMSVIL